MKPIVYVDVLFIINFLVNTILIYITAKISKREITIMRLLTFSIISALYASIMFFPKLKIFYTVCSKIIFSGLLVLFAFRTYNLRMFLKAFLVFYLVSFAFGGTVFGLMFFTNMGSILGTVISNGEIYFNLNIGTLLVAVVFAYLTMIVFAGICKRNYSRDKIICEFEITFRGKSVRLKGLIDTGCELADPFSKMPVMVASSNSLKDIISVENSKNMINEVLLNPSIFEGSGIRLIPFSDLGTENGFIPAFIPDEIIETSGKYIVQDRVSVGITELRLSDDGLYDAILNPDILEAKKLKERGRGCVYENT